MYKEGIIVAKGAWIYNNAVECEVVIQKVPIFYGSGDHEDPPEVRDDRKEETFYIWFGSTIPKNSYTGGGHAFTLEKAKVVAERVLGQEISWH